MVTNVEGMYVGLKQLRGDWDCCTTSAAKELGSNFLFEIMIVITGQFKHAIYVM